MFDAAQDDLPFSPALGALAEAGTPMTLRPRRPESLSRRMSRAEGAGRLMPDPGPGLFDGVFDDLPAPPRAADARVAQSRARAQRMLQAAQMAENLWRDEDEPAPDAPLVANDLPDLPPADVLCAERLRAALYAPISGEGPSPQMRLAVHAMNGTLIAVAAPVGAAVMTYSLLRGENMRLTAGALAVCGFAMAILQTGVSALV